MPEVEARQLLGLTTAQVYGSDVARLSVLADRIGPSTEDVHGAPPLARVPADVWVGLRHLDLRSVTSAVCPLPRCCPNFIR